MKTNKFLLPLTSYRLGNSYRMVNLLGLMVLTCSLCPVFVYGQMAEIDVPREFPFLEKFWSIEDALGIKGDLDTLVYEGKSSIRLVGTQRAHLNLEQYENFTIEFYCLGAGPGLGFRASSRKEFEYLYLRVPLSGKRDALQYVPVVNGSLPWQLYNYPGYEGPATYPRKEVGKLPLSYVGKLGKGVIDKEAQHAFEQIGVQLSSITEVIPEEEGSWFVFDPETRKSLALKKDSDAVNVLDFLTWIHTRIEVENSKMSIFIEDMETPAFTINELEMKPREGSISLIGDGREVYFADVTITKLRTRRHRSTTPQRKSLTNYLTKWYMSEMFTKDTSDVTLQVDSVLNNKTNLNVVRANSNGLINISRYYDDMTKTVALTCDLVSDVNQTVNLDFDYADHLVILSSSKVIFDQGMNFNAPSGKGEEGRVFVNDERVELDLKKGTNQLTFVLSGDDRQKFNWGFIAKLDDDTTGVIIDK